jgi:hypothetical protein
MHEPLICHRCMLISATLKVLGFISVANGKDRRFVNVRCIKAGPRSKPRTLLYLALKHFAVEVKFLEKLVNHC